MAVQVTLDTLRAFSRSLDERLTDTTKYPDSWIDSKIDSAYETIGTKSQAFLKEEVLDLTDYIADGTLKFDIDMDEDVTGWKAAFYERNGDYIYEYKIKTRFVAGEPVGILIKPDNTVLVDIAPDITLTDIHTITFQYYYYPHTSTGDQFFSTDIYHMVTNAIASTIYEDLRDYEQRDNFDNQLAKQYRTQMNGLDMDADNVRKSNWNI